MSRFYLNVKRYGRNLLVREYNNGEVINYKHPYKPTLYVETDKPSEYKGFLGENVAPVDFGSMSDATDFVKSYKDVPGYRIHGQQDYVLQYLAEEYPDEIEFDSSKIRVANVDIETASEGGFPYADEANYEVNAITLYDNIDDTYYVWGLGEWQLKDTELDFITYDNVEYVHCKDEADLFIRFINHFHTKQYVVFTGWNINNFDIPYIINRGRKIVGEKIVNKLSPWGIIQEKNSKGKFGKETITYDIYGVSILDYIELYQYYSRATLDSYSLDSVANHELGEKKLDYSDLGSIHTIYKTNFQTWIDYNIKDVRLVQRIEEKNKFIELVYSLSYYPKINHNDVFATVKTWDSIIHYTLLERNIIVPPKEYYHKESFGGGYVKEPIPNIYDWLVSVDLNSLYPHLLIQYNISPETLITSDDLPQEIKALIASIKFMNDEKGNKMMPMEILNKEKNIDLLKEYNISMAANGACYRRDKKGLFPELMESLYKVRKADKKEMLRWESILEAGDKTDAEFVKNCKANISKFNNNQLAKKVLLNSLYGALGAPYFRYFNIQNAEAVTLSGQLSTRWAGDRLNIFFNEILKTEGKDYIVAADTDSLYITLNELVKTAFKNNDDEIKIVDALDGFMKKIVEPKISNIYDELADYMNAYENKMVMEREVIASKGFWTGKKRYALNVWDSEGVRYEKPKMKYMGLSAKSSATNTFSRPKLVELYKLVMESDNKTIIKYIEEFNKEWNNISIDDIAIPKGINGVKKYSDQNGMPIKGAPKHVKSALAHNRLIKKLGLNTIEPISDGDKIKFIELKSPNPIGSEVIGFKNHLPDEFDLEQYINRDLMFEKGFLDPARTVLDPLNLKHKEEATLEDLFG